jgi:hypothetical protein
MSSSTNTSAERRKEERKCRKETKITYSNGCGDLPLSQLR